MPSRHGSATNCFGQSHGQGCHPRALPGMGRRGRLYLCYVQAEWRNRLSLGRQGLQGPGDWATMYLYVKKEGFKSTGFVEMPATCAERDFVESSPDICSYKVTVSCLCNPEAPSTSPSFAPSFSPSAAPSFAPSSMPSAAPSSMPSSAPSSAPSAELETRRIRSLATEGNYHCSLGKYACADGPDHVEICHYSSRTGYKTYCVPQSDSEIV